MEHEDKYAPYDAERRCAHLIVMGWAVGLVVSGIILRYGLGAESIAWFAIFALLPLSGVYYPISVLPEWVQSISFFLPASHVFEGMRAVIIDGAFRVDLLVNAVALNAVYLAAGLATFLYFFKVARRGGQLLQVGE